ncbi:MAG: outer membrane beta-barrel family protein, partial [Ignavibacteriae bacterium]|nr:outer membrane beta-barrel family protein [Ignavibacteriota bacterium]
YKGENTSNITYFQPQSFFNSNTNSDGNSKYYFGGVGIEYEMKKGHNLGFDTYLNTSRFNNTSNMSSNNYNAFHLLTSLYKNNYAGDGKWDNYSASLYYNGKFDKIGKELNFDMTFKNAKNENNANQTIQYYDSLSIPVNNTPSKQMNITNGKNQNLRFQLDYSNPFNDKTKFETGYKGTFRSNDNDFRSDTLNYILNSFVKNNDVTNHFKLSEYIDAVYGTFSHKIKMFRFKLGLRLEHTYTKGELITDGTNFTKDYLNLFPTLSISQKIGISHELQLSYSRRITRPMIYRLNPFVNRYNSKFIYMGNPELSPEYTDSYELSYMFISNIINLTPMAFYRRSTNVISNYSYITDTNVTVTTYRNSSSGYSYGMDFIVSSRALKWWNINSTFSFYKSKFDADVTNDYSGEEGFSWKANIRSFFTIGEVFNLEIYYDYTGKKVNASGFNQPSQSLDISINKNFFKKKLTIGIRGEDLFKTRKWGSETNGIGLKSVYDYSWDSRGVYLNISYNFGNSEDYYKKSKKTKQNENEKSDSNEEGNK